MSRPTRLALSSALATLLLSCAAAPSTAGDPPRLLVLVSVDQCRAEYLERFLPALPADGGFRRLLDGGAVYAVAAHTHTVTSTGPGHAALATGCLPARAGIPENEWIDATTGARIYCVADPEGGFSAALLERPALGDVLQERLGDRALVVSASFKDRTALLLGGRRADASAWFDMQAGRWVGRTAGADAVPAWAADCNGGPSGPGPLPPLAEGVWEPRVPEALAARLAGPDDAPGEDRAGSLGTTFPHAMPAAGTPADVLSYHVAVSPWCDALTLQTVLAALEAEPLGRDAVPDLLCVGFSGLDNVGHAFGPDSREMLEAFVALDRVLAGLMDALDARVGTGAWTLALSSDHGLAPVPEQSGGLRIVRGPLEQALEAELEERYGTPPVPAGGTSAHWLQGVAKPSVYLDHATLERAHLDAGEVAEHVAQQLAARPGFEGAWTRAALAAVLEHPEAVVAEAVVADAVVTDAAPEDVAALARDVHPTRSGDVLFLLTTNTVFTGSVATDHGSHHAYDREVPVLLYGAGVAPGRPTRTAAPIDLAPTLARLAGLGDLPDVDGRVLIEALAASPAR